MQVTDLVDVFCYLSLQVLLVGQGKGQLDAGPASRGRPDAHTTVVHEYHLLHDGQSQPRPVGRSAPRRVGPVEAFEDVGEIGRRDADAVVGDVQPDPV